jgi:hypothetical protein
MIGWQNEAKISSKNMQMQIFIKKLGNGSKICRSIEMKYDAEATYIQQS